MTRESTPRPTGDRASGGTKDLAARLRKHVETRTVVLEDAGHFVQLEQPQEFSRLVIEFIAAAGERAP